jgi:uracil-DNA glycosylase
MATKSEKLERIVELWQGCDNCELHLGRKQVVFWRGNLDARLAIVGEAPGETEDNEGKPFAGVAGRTLDKQLDKLGIEPWDIFICNVVGCRPPKNRPPTDVEIDACRARTVSMLYVVKPQVILTLGLTALGFLVGLPKLSIARGKQYTVEIPLLKLKPVKVIVVPTWHPALLARKPYEPELVTQFVSDIRLAQELSQDGSWLEHD